MSAPKKSFDVLIEEFIRFQSPKQQSINGKFFFEIPFDKFYQKYLFKAHYLIQKEGKDIKPKQFLRKVHIIEIGKAIKENKNIPTNILKEYQFFPDLFKDIRRHANRHGINLD